MSDVAERPAGAGLRARWRARTAIYSRAVWALMIALDPLPRPWGEDLVARLFAIVGMLRPSRRRRALRWARQQPGHRPWHLAAALCAFLGRWTARSMLLGFRSPDAFRRHLVVEGAEHLNAGPEGAILLAFHVGPPNADIGLKVFGHSLTTLARGHRNSPGWWRPAWQSLLDENPDLHTGGNEDRWLGVLYQARRVLLGGGTIYLMADGIGRELSRVPLPGGPAVIRAGWLTLHRRTGVRVLPLLTHMRGRTQVIAIHPELPLTEPDPARGISGWQEALQSLLEDYVRRFPEQCLELAFSDESRERIPSAGG